jgi:hypothetical protein
MEALKMMHLIELYMAEYRCFSREPFGGGEIKCLTCKTVPYILDLQDSTFYSCLEMQGADLFDGIDYHIVRCDCGLGLIQLKTVYMKPGKLVISEVVVTDILM